MIVEPTIDLEKRKFSAFEEKQIGGESPETLKKVFLAGYAAGDDGTTKNVKVNLNDILASGGAFEKSGTAYDGLSDSATFEVDGYTKKTSGSDFVWTFDIAKTGKYIQINDIPLEAFKEIDGVLYLDIALINTGLGSVMSVYLPDFGPHDDNGDRINGITKPFGLRVFMLDPLSISVYAESKNPLDIEGNEPRVVFTSESVDATSAKSYDWFAKFVELGAAVIDGNIARASRPCDVLNIYDNDILG